MQVRGPGPLAHEAAAHEDPFLRWHIGVDAPALVWRADDALAVVVDRGHGTGVVTTGFGRALDAVLDAALAHLRAEGVAEVRLSVPAEAGTETLPDDVREVSDLSHWEWMWTDSPPAAPVGVAWLTRAYAPAVADLLAHSPLAHARPGDASVRGWAGIRLVGRLVAAGALCVTASGTPHLRGIVTHPDHRGRGLGAAVTASLTLRGLESSPVVTLGMYSDNDGARRIYHRLGYRTSHRWLSSRVRLSAG